MPPFSGTVDILIPNPRCIFCGQRYDPTRRRWFFGLLGPIRIHWCPNYRKLRLHQGPIVWKVVSY